MIKHARRLTGIALLGFAVKTLAAPPTPVAVVQAFIDPLLRETSTEYFGQNRHGQLEALSPRLQHLVRIAECDFARANEEEPAPYQRADASLVFNRWDIPTTCVSQPLTSESQQATVKVRCEWDGSTDHQAGQWMAMRFDLAKVNGAWHIEQATHLEQNDGPTDGTTLSDRLIAAGQQSSNPATCQHAP